MSWPQYPISRKWNIGFVVVLKISLGDGCGPEDACVDMNARCLQGVCRCNGDFVAIGNQCGKFSRQNKWLCVCYCYWHSFGLRERWKKPSYMLSTHAYNGRAIYVTYLYWCFLGSVAGNDWHDLSRRGHMSLASHRMCPADVCLCSQLSPVWPRMS